MKLLIADDSKVSRMMLVAITKEWGFDIIEAADGEQAWNIMQEPDAPQLILLDWEMPKLNGIEVCSRITAKKLDMPPYIVMLSSRSSSHDIVEGLSKGANDYISKPFDTAELQARLQVGKRFISMQNKLNNTLNELTELASYDALTGLLNRRSIMKALPKKIKRISRTSNVLCIGMCDIDNFKQINDTHGHVIGDAVLREVSARMRDTLRESDLIGRYGGEEFLIITAVDADGGNIVYDRICKNVSAQSVKVDELLIPVTVSCGVARYSEELDKQDMKKFITRADNALYQAKNSGRNQVVFSDK